MALRDQPYLPLYIQDFLTDEKLNECSAAATGVYIKLMCLLHKSDPYGKILLKQKDKQTGDQKLNFASKFAKLLPYDVAVILSALEELLREDVIQLDGDFLLQKRMVKDGQISLTRSKSGQRGGEVTQNKNRDFAKANNKANNQANSEYEIEYAFVLSKIESLIDKEADAKILSMVVIEMMAIWMDKKPDYRVYKEQDYNACLNIAYLIGDVKKIKRADVVGIRESDILQSWKKIVDFICTHTFYTTLTLTAIAATKMFQRIENSMREFKNAAPIGSGIPMEEGLAEARKNFKSQLPKDE